MNNREVLAHVPSLTRQELYRYAAKGYIKPKKHTVGKIERNDYSEADAKLVRSIKYHHMSGWAAERTLEQAYRLALKDMGKGVADVLRT